MLHSAEFSRSHASATLGATMCRDIVRAILWAFHAYCRAWSKNDSFASKFDYSARACYTFVQMSKKNAEKLAFFELLTSYQQVIDKVLSRLKVAPSTGRDHAGLVTNWVVRAGSSMGVYS